MTIYNVFTNDQLDNTYREVYVSSHLSLNGAFAKVKQVLEELYRDNPDDSFKINLLNYTEHNRTYLEPIVFIEEHDLQN